MTDPGPTHQHVPGDLVRHPGHPEWGIGQVQSAIGTRVTVNFENVGKQLINVAVIGLQTVTNVDDTGG